jgi:hypothetical protein
MMLDLTGYLVPLYAALTLVVVVAVAALIAARRAGRPRRRLSSA